MKKRKISIGIFSVLSAISLFATNNNVSYLAVAPETTVNSVPEKVEKDIKGYVAGGETVYNIEIYWNKDMTFVYDKGKYNPTTGQIESSMAESGTAGAVTVDYVEKGGVVGKANQWYGFDGINNRIVVLNKSNTDVYTKFSVNKKVDTPAGDTVAFKLYEGDKDKMELEETSPGSKIYLPKSFNDVKDRTNRFGTETELGNAAVRIEKTPGDGTANCQKVFLGISGSPSDGLANDKASAAAIGTITVNISDSDATISS